MEMIKNLACNIVVSFNIFFIKILQQHGCKQCKNLPEDEKPKACWVNKKNYKMKKKPCYNYKNLFLFRESAFLSASIFKRV